MFVHFHRLLTYAAPVLRFLPAVIFHQRKQRKSWPDTKTPTNYIRETDFSFFFSCFFFLSFFWSSARDKH